MSQSDLPNILRNRKVLARWVSAVAAGVTAAVLAIAFTTPPGPGLDPDSASYLGAAQSLAGGRGYRIPIADWSTSDSTAPLSHFPPAYPTALALPIALGARPTNAARAIDAAAGFVDIALVLWLVASISGLGAGVAAVLALFAMPAFVETHLSVLSEPLFLACLVGTLVAMVSASRQTEEGARLQRGVLAGIVAAAAMLTRYAGTAVVGAVVLWMLYLPGPPAARLRRAVIASVPAIFLGSFWVLHLHLTSGVRGVRTISTYGGLLDTLAMGVSTIVAWVVPLMSDQTLPGRGWFALAGIVMLVIVVVRSYRTGGQSMARTAIAAALTMALCYVVVLVASRVLADPNIPFDNRILSPVFLLLTVIAAIAIRECWRQWRLPARIVSVALVLAWFGASITVVQDEVSWALENGEDFAQEQWSKSPLLAWARLQGSQRPLYTNWPAAVFFYLHRPSHEVPHDTAPDLRAFTDTVRTRNGVVIIFDTPSPGEIGADALAQAAGFRRVARFADGSAFTVR